VTSCDFFFESLLKRENMLGMVAIRGGFRQWQNDGRGIRRREFNDKKEKSGRGRAGGVAGEKMEMRLLRLVEEKKYFWPSS